MSTAAAVQAGQPPLDIDALHRKVQEHISRTLTFQVRSDGYFPLFERLHQAKNGQISRDPKRDIEQLRADLVELLDAPADVLRRMVMQRATSARCIPPEHERMMALQQIAANHQALQEALRPKLSPAELIAAFAARGLVITKALDGNLHVTPADALTAADRDMLRANKGGILHALDANAEVI